MDGRVAKPHSRAYMVSVQVSGHHFCEGILVQEDFVLTAAHCKPPGEMTVVLGAHDISKKEKSQQRIKVAEYFKHPLYDGKVDNAIMLLKLEKNATLNKFVKTIGLPKKEGKIPANIKCAVAGWGRTGQDGLASDVLREKREKMQFPFEGRTIWQQHFDKEHMICTKFTRKAGGMYQRGSGGVLICNSKPQGIPAFTAFKSNNRKYPDVFTKINSFIPWIEVVMHGRRKRCMSHSFIGPEYFPFFTSLLNMDQ